MAEDGGASRGEVVALILVVLLIPAVLGAIPAFLLFQGAEEGGRRRGLEDMVAELEARGALEPAAAPTFCELAALHLEQGRLRDAGEVADRALVADAFSARAHLILARIEIAEGRDGAAARRLRSLRRFGASADEVREASEIEAEIAARGVVLPPGPRSSKRVILVGMAGTRGEVVDRLADRIEATFSLRVEVARHHPRPLAIGVEELVERRYRRFCRDGGYDAAVAAADDWRGSIPEVRELVGRVSANPREALLGLEAALAPRLDADRILAQVIALVEPSLEDGDAIGAVALMAEGMATGDVDEVIGWEGTADVALISLEALGADEGDERLTTQTFRHVASFLGVRPCGDPACSLDPARNLAELDRRSGRICRPCQAILASIVAPAPAGD